jgi:D-serine deaminase-like pyridoxal phosphate-dependent protein
VTSISDLPTPALLLDLDKLDRNLQRMASKAENLGVALRPHIKTHKCVEIARRQASLGARGITVSTLYEARVFARNGFDDITWAYPLIVSRLHEVANLAREVTLRVVVDSADAVVALETLAQPLHVWLKVDCGYHRAGVDPDRDASVELAERITESPYLNFDGILTHSGHAYHATSGEDLRNIALEERSVMIEFAEKLRQRGIPRVAVSIGSTPAMSAAADLSGVSEIRPGNYALYDLTQVRLGAARVRDCAATVLTTVVSAAPGRCVIDAGALSLSKDLGPSTAERPSYGEIFSDYERGALDSGRQIVDVSQEHGIVAEASAVGDKLRILPNHSCLTVAHFDAFVVVRGDSVVDRWKIWRGRD